MLIGLIAWRVVYRLTHPAPPMPASMPGWQRRVAALTHAGLYLLLIVMPLSGFIRVRSGGFPIELLDAFGAGPWLPRNDAVAAVAQGVHFIAAIVLIGLLALHIGAALWHGLVARDGIWQRIWPLRAPKG